MKRGMYVDVVAFNRKFKVPRADFRGDRRDKVLKELLGLKKKHLFEELFEFNDAVEVHDHEKAVDALVDLVYVAFGTAYLLKLPFEKVWARVHRANMKKVRATKDTLGKRGSTFDIVKPAGWKAPDVAGCFKPLRTK